MEKVIDGDIGHGESVKVQYNEYDENGRNIRRTIDEDGDGNIDQEFNWKYDENGDLTRRTHIKYRDT